MITISWTGLLFILFLAIDVGVVIGLFLVALAQSAGLQDEEKQREHPERRYF